MSGPKSILVKLDGSSYSHVATELAIQWAKECDCRLSGISVVNEIGILTRQTEESLGETELRHEQLRKSRECADRYLDVFATRCQGEGLVVSTCREKGQTADTILREVQRHDLVLLGRESHFHSSSFPDASLAKVLRNCPRPIVTVPLCLPQEQAIMIAYDAHPPASRALYAFLQSGLAKSRDVHVVCVHKDRHQATADAALAVDFLIMHEVKATVHPIDSKLAAHEVMVPMIGELDVGLLVAGAYGKSRSAEFFFGSTTQKLIKESPVPVFMFH
jgi:nucleotide-binding universal stress UspA family protein